MLTARTACYVWMVQLGHALCPVDMSATVWHALKTPNSSSESEKGPHPACCVVQRSGRQK